MANAKGLSLRGGRRPTWRLSAKREEVPLGCNLAVPGCIVGKLPAKSQLPSRDCHGPLGPRNDTSGGYCGAPAPSSGLIPLCEALNERRYRRNRSVRFYRHLVRTGSAFPRLPRPLWGLAMKKSERFAPQKVCRNHCQPAWRSMSAATDAIGRCVFIGTLYELEVPSRDCHVASLLAMTRQGGTAMGTVRRTELAVLLPLRGRAWLSPPLQGQCGLNDGKRMIHSSFFILQYSLFLISSIPLRGWQTI